MSATLDLIDEFLVDTKHQSLIDADRVRDLLLDLRTLLGCVDEPGPDETDFPPGDGAP